MSYKAERMQREIDALKSEAGKWVLCGERLPKHDQYVSAIQDVNGVWTYPESRFVVNETFEDGAFFYGTGYFVDNCLVHRWYDHTIPEPPEVEA